MNVTIINPIYELISYFVLAGVIAFAVVLFVIVIAKVIERMMESVL